MKYSSYSIPLLIPNLPTAEEVLPCLHRIDQRHWYANFGPLVCEFEEKVLNLFRTSQGEDSLYVTTVSSGTTGLELALTVLDLPPNARILIPAFTFVATATAVVRCGFQPIFADVDKNSWILTPDIAREVLQQKSFEAIIPVATFGCPQDVVAWESFYAETGVSVIIDAAGAFGNQNIGKNVLTVFSLHATKTFGVGEGGIVASGNQEYINIIRELSNFGINKSVDGIRYLKGTNAKMSEYHAAVGLVVLQKWQDRQVHYQQLYQTYISKIQDFCLPIKLQCKPEDGIYATFQVILPEYCDNRLVANNLNAQGIETRFWYTPLVCDHAPFAACQNFGLTNSRRIVKSIIGLPFHLCLYKQEIFLICTQLARIIKG